MQEDSVWECVVVVVLVWRRGFVKCQDVVVCGCVMVVVGGRGEGRAGATRWDAPAGTRSQQVYTMQT